MILDAMTLYFDEEDVGRLLPMKVAVSRVEEAFRLLGDGSAENRPRARSRAGKVMLHVMSGGSGELGYLGLKAYTTGPAGARFYVLLFSAQDGRLVSVIAADRLGQIRTGAASGVATRYLAPKDASRVGIYGTGWQARSQLEAIACVRPLVSAIAFGRDEERRRSFCREMSQTLGIPVEPAKAPEQVAERAEILVTATNARQPVLQGAWLRPGQHVNAVGSNSLARREVDEAVVTRASFIAADSVEQAKIECGDLDAVVQSGKLSWDRVQELSGIVAGKLSFQRKADDVTLFESQGLAIEDIAAAKAVYEAGRAEGAGRDVDF
jgi:ornithine cyclodeaminase/alanine dehydrogenase-like protein (mu-crystallin family)